MLRKAIEILFHKGDEIPAVEDGDLDTFVLAVIGETGTIYCCAADYLNNFPIWLEPPEGADNCNATGWFDHLPGDNDEIVRPFLFGNDVKIVGWCPMHEIAERLNRLQVLH